MLVPKLCSLRYTLVANACAGRGMLPRPQGFNEATNTQTARVFTGTSGFSLCTISAIACLGHDRNGGDGF